MEIQSDYLSDNKDFEKFLDRVSDNTGNIFTKRWQKNAGENIDLFRKTGWACPILQDVEEGKTAVIIGSSPAVKNQVGQLKELQDDTGFVLCSLSSNLEWLLNNGIIPKYCIVVDADESTGKDWDAIDMDKTKDITLIAVTVCYPLMLRKWKGPLYFLVLITDDKKVKKIHLKMYRNINGNGTEFPTLMGQFNIMTAFAFSVLNCPIIIFVGNELSYSKKDSTYYVDRKDPRDVDRKGVQGDIHGNVVETNHNLLALKISLERFLESLSGAGWFFNCTEAGIFGVTKRYPGNRVPWIHQLKLSSGVMQARSIMRTGKPFTLYDAGSSIQVPKLGGLYV
jgi:hypothetical protein